MKQHKHAELIKAWADGAIIEHNNGLGYWVEQRNPQWNEWDIYRIKPEPKPEPVKQTLYIYNNNEDGKSWITHQPPDRVITNDRFHQYMGSIEVAL